MGSEETQETTVQRGIFDCDEAYKTPTSADHKRLFESGTIVVDTNVLINLYRSNDRTRRDTFAVLRQLQNQLWVPHQVLSEFWRNRDLPSIRGHHRAKAQTACAALDKAMRSMSDAADRWLKDVHLDTDDAANHRISDYRDRVQAALGEMKRFIERQAEDDALDGTESTHTDPILLQLEPLLLGKIGDPLTSSQYAEAIKEAKRRADEEIPPGYKDYGAKSEELAAGDYIIWRQVMNEATQIGRDVLLITGDVKEDWWTPRSGSSPARPRSELRNEMRQEAGVELFMMTPSQLLTEASDAFKLKVDERSVSDLARREGYVDAFPQIFRSIIVESISSAHTRALHVHEVSGLKERSPYSITMTQAVMEALTNSITSIGGRTLTVKGIEYPAFEGFLIIPLKIGPRNTPVRAIRSKTLKDVAETLNPEQPMFDFSNLRPYEEMFPIIALYSSSPDGIESIEILAGRFDSSGEFDVLHSEVLI